MKFLTAFLLLLAVLPCGATLKFDTPELDAHAGLNDKTLIREFSFTNTGSKPVKITQADAGCSCLAVEVAGGKFNYAPGEKGVIRATFEVGNFQGMVEKNILVWLATDPEDRPSGKVTLRVHIPVIIALEPRTLRWPIGGELEPQLLDVKMQHDKPIRVKAVTTSNESFTTRLITVDEGKHYQVEVTPTGTARGGMSIVRIETDSDVEKQKVQQAFAVISALPAQP